MTKFIVHIGDGKCGSSSVQKSLFDAREALLTHGILYATTTPNQGHFNLATLAGKTLRSADDTAKKSALDTIALVRENVRPDSTVLLSAENFFNLKPESLIEVLRLISDDIEQVDLIAYLRAPDSMYLSLVQQILKGDSRFTMPHKFARTVDKILRRWERSPQINSLIVHKFDRRALVNRDVVDDFCAILRDLTQQSDITLPHASENATLSAEQMIVLQRYRKRLLKDHDGKLHKDSQRLIAYFDKINTLGFPGSKPALNAAAISSVRDANHDIFSAVHGMFPDLGLGPEPLSEPATAPEIWEPESGVEQILRDVDHNLVELVEHLAFGLATDVDAMALRLHALAQGCDLDTQHLFSATTAFWRAAGYVQSAEFLDRSIADLM